MQEKVALVQNIMVGIDEMTKNIKSQVYVKHTPVVNKHKIVIKKYEEELQNWT